MPVYEWRCAVCGKRVDHDVSMSDYQTLPKPKCCGCEMKRVFAPVPLASDRKTEGKRCEG